MLKKALSIALVGIISYSAFIWASPNTPAAKTQLSTPENAALKATLTEKIGVAVTKIVTTPFPDVLLVMTERGTFYVSTDGNFFIQGNIYDLRGAQPVDLAQASMAETRLEGVERFKNDMIVYPAKDEKHVITVFTDITCGYCVKLHSQMAEYNEKGITVRYLAYPRSGLYSDQTQQNFSSGFKNLRSIWCNEDPAAAMTKAKANNRSPVPERICDKPIAEQFKFGQQVGVTGTPAIITANGDLIPGYRPPADLVAVLNAQK